MIRKNKMMEESMKKKKNRKRNSRNYSSVTGKKNLMKTSCNNGNNDSDIRSILPGRNSLEVKELGGFTCNAESESNYETTKSMLSSLFPTPEPNKLIPDSDRAFKCDQSNNILLHVENRNNKIGSKPSDNVQYTLSSGLSLSSRSPETSLDGLNACFNFSLYSSNCQSSSFTRLDNADSKVSVLSSDSVCSASSSSQKQKKLILLKRGSSNRGKGISCAAMSTCCLSSCSQTFSSAAFCSDVHSTTSYNYSPYDNMSHDIKCGQSRKIGISEEIKLGLEKNSDNDEKLNEMNFGSLHLNGSANVNSTFQSAVTCETQNLLPKSLEERIKLYDEIRARIFADVGEKKDNSVVLSKGCVGSKSILGSEEPFDPAFVRRSVIGGGCVPPPPPPPPATLFRGNPAGGMISSCPEGIFFTGQKNANACYTSFYSTESCSSLLGCCSGDFCNLPRMHGNYPSNYSCYELMNPRSCFNNVIYGVSTSQTSSIQTYANNSVSNVITSVNPYASEYYKPYSCESTCSYCCTGYSDSGNQISYANVYLRQSHSESYFSMPHLSNTYNFTPCYPSKYFNHGNHSLAEMNNCLVYPKIISYHAPYNISCSEIDNSSDKFSYYSSTNFNVVLLHTASFPVSVSESAGTTFPSTVVNADSMFSYCSNNDCSVSFINAKNVNDKRGNSKGLSGASGGNIIGNSKCNSTCAKTIHSKGSLDESGGTGSKIDRYITGGKVDSISSIEISGNRRNYVPGLQDCQNIRKSSALPLDRQASHIIPLPIESSVALHYDSLPTIFMMLQEQSVSNFKRHNGHNSHSCLSFIPQCQSSSCKEECIIPGEKLFNTESGQHVEPSFKVKNFCVNQLYCSLSGNNDLSSNIFSNFNSGNGNNKMVSSGGISTTNREDRCITSMKNSTFSIATTATLAQPYSCQPMNVKGKHKNGKKQFASSIKGHSIHNSKDTYCNCNNDTSNSNIDSHSTTCCINQSSSVTFSSNTISKKCMTNSGYMHGSGKHKGKVKSK